MNSLQSSLGHDFIFDHGHYKINACGPNIACTSQNSSVSACEIQKDNKTIVLGYESKLIWENGRLTLNFTGEKCNDSENYTLTTILLCDYDAINMKYPIQVVPKVNTKDCHTFAHWHTDVACLPKYSTKNNCIVKTKNNEIDLNQLDSMNHKVMSGSDGSYFLINLCQPVLYGIGSTCPLGSSVCYVDQSNKDVIKYRNFGTLQNVSFEHEKYVMHYGSDEICKKDVKIQTKIILDCDPKEDQEEPVFITQNECIYIFYMKTSIVCNTIKPCTVFDKKSSKLIDLSPLANITYSVKRNQSDFLYAVCSSPLEPCSNTDGICETEILDKSKTKPSTSFGEVSTNLQLNGTDNHVTYLEYENGAICKNDQKWKTQLVFHCDEKNSVPSVLVEDSNCTLVISHPTNLMCGNPIRCHVTTEDGRIIDLSVLKEKKGNYLAKINPSLEEFKYNKYYLHVCRPLYLERGLNCPGSSSCRTVKTTDGKDEHETSLGYPDVGLTMIGDTPTLKYLHGGECDKDNTTDFSTEIRFKCDPSQGNVSFFCSY